MSSPAPRRSSAWSAASRGRLFLMLLEHALVADEAFEREMTRLRRELLAAPSLESCCALAQQCFLNEYVWPETEAEAALVSRLEPSARTPLELATLGMYRPLSGNEKPRDGGRLRAPVAAAGRGAGEEVAGLERLTTVEDDVSRRVQAQYEANPYPRWQRAPCRAPSPRAHAALAFPARRPTAKLAAPDAPRILIAGCGTGRHAAVTAQLQPHGRVLAVDISRASLAYAMRRCAELGLANLRFAQADILQLGALGGALRPHRVLRRAAPHARADGRLARAAVAARAGRLHEARSLLGAGAAPYRGCARKLAGLEVRQARARIFALPADDPARQVTALRLLQRFGRARPAPARAGASLHHPSARWHGRRARRRVPRLRAPGRKLAMSLEQWDAYETANPDTFASMYQFWIRKP